MIQTKRYLNDDESSDDNTKKLQKRCDDNRIITCLESLSNEIFYEIFEYLDGYKLYEAFSNLNQRFQNLLICLPPPLKIDLRYCHGKIFQNRYTDIVIPNRHKIISLRLPTYSFNDCNFNAFKLDSSFSRLEALTLHGRHDAPVSELEHFLPILLSLPQLVSLTIVGDHVGETKTAYETLFKLPMLKYIKVSCLYSELNDLSMATNNQFGGIEHLVIDHSCRPHELIHILSYTPRIRHLSCTCMSPCRPNSVIKEINPISNLTHISFKRIYAKFNELERFIFKKTPNLQVLRIGFFEDVACLDANRWEQLISRCLTHLRILEFKCRQKSSEELDASQYFRPIPQFKSSFWIERKWLLRLYIDTYLLCRGYSIIYSIFTDRKNSSNFLKVEENNENYFTNVKDDWRKYYIRFDGMSSENYTVVDEMNQLNVMHHLVIYPHFIEEIAPILNNIKIRCLNVIYRTIGNEVLMRLIKYLPPLNSLAVSALQMTDFTRLSADELKNLRSRATNNKITKVKLREMKNLEEGQFLLDLCRSIEYFEIDCSNSVTPEVFTRFILKRNSNDNPYLCSLCLEIPPNNENIVENLKKIIDDEQLREKYTIKQKDDRIYLQWT